MNDIQERYSRQILLSEMGLDGQKILTTKKVAIVGMGALGSMAAELLCRAGVGSLLLIDRDVVEESNLQRQVLYAEQDIGCSKAAVAKERLEQINSQIQLFAHPVNLQAQNMALLQDVDLILDCTDNLQTRFLINDYCAKEQKKWIYAAVIKMSGYVCPFLPGGPCLRCFLEKSTDETCDTVGVLNTAVSAVSSLQVTLALKMLLDREVSPQLLHCNVWESEIKKINLQKKPNCPACRGNFPALANSEEKIIRFCSTGKFQMMGKPVDKKLLQERWSKLGKVVDDGITLTFQNIQVFPDGRVLIKAESKQEAKAMYSRYIGN